MYGTTLYDANWWQKLTGMDWGTDRCLRNSKEAYVCFSEMMYQAESRFGWNTQVVNYIVTQAYQYSGRSNLKDSAYFFWENIQKNFMTWIKNTGWNIADLPNWQAVLRQIDSSTDGAFSYAQAEKEANEIFQKVALQTSSDLWYLWQTKVPKKLRIATYIIAGGAILSYTYPLLNLAYRAITLPSKMKKKE